MAQWSFFVVVVAVAVIKDRRRERNHWCDFYHRAKVSQITARHNFYYFFFIFFTKSVKDLFLQISFELCFVNFLDLYFGYAIELQVTEMKKKNLTRNIFNNNDCLFFFLLSLNKLLKNTVLKNGMKTKENVTFFYREIAKINLFCWILVEWIHCKKCFSNQINERLVENREFLIILTITVHLVSFFTAGLIQLFQPFPKISDLNSFYWFQFHGFFIFWPSNQKLFKFLNKILFSFWLLCSCWCVLVEAGRHALSGIYSGFYLCSVFWYFFFVFYGKGRDKEIKTKKILDHFRFHRGFVLSVPLLSKVWVR